MDPNVAPTVDPSMAPYRALTASRESRYSCASDLHDHVSYLGGFAMQRICGATRNAFLTFSSITAHDIFPQFALYGS